MPELYIRQIVSICPACHIYTGLFHKDPLLLFAFIKHLMYFCSHKGNIVFIYKTNHLDRFS
ncbi:hypothetical protein HMPREF9446_02581 [Bacteroides fluxus YIT 12057]|uniref:Uncharacterized protein n=1 Tax=Bacteroides fluxus YIT 12057 TaxID=763034 RepID=F3PV07_9BACE|nr:hypothetical protein HMPREF9446_02581 [Bacteroides fluxus YIT 12057]